MLHLDDLEKSATVTITIAGESGNDTAVVKERTLRRKGVMWKYRANQQNNGEGFKITKMTMWWAPEGGRWGSRWSGWAGFHVRGVLELSEDLGMDTEPAEATVTVEMPVSMEAGSESLLGEENVTFKVNRSMNLWSYHGSNRLRRFPCDPRDTD